MKKVGITTITAARSKGFNYGNILQNYALSFYIQKYLFEVTTIYYSSTVPQFTFEKFSKEKEKKSIMQIIDDILRVLKRNYNKEQLELKKQHRDEGFLKFIEKYLMYTEKTYTVDSDLRELNKKFDYFITGSDQVWNPYYEGSNEFYYLSFADKEKRIAYAPSIGVNHIPDEIKEKIGKWLNNFKSISIREEEGKKIIKNNYGLDSIVVCDPVFLLDKYEWLQLLEKKQNEKSYFAVYILGKKNIKTKKNIKLLEKKYKLESKDIYTWDDPDSLFCSPIEFLEIFNGAEFIVTDSFHAVAFSIIFEKPVVIVDRNASIKHSTYKMNGRIENVLQLAGLKNRNIEDILSEKSEMYDVSDFDNSKLKDLIMLSKKYLLNSLKINSDIF